MNYMKRCLLTFKNTATKMKALSKSLENALKQEKLQVKCITPSMETHFFFLSETCKTANIAVVKYWGKINERFVIPLNDNISVTLKDLTTTTTVIASEKLEKNHLVLNGEVRNIESDVRLSSLFSLAFENNKNELMDVKKQNFYINSTNNFPTASGLASSASGLASIAYGICSLMNIEDEITTSIIARVGSGSACRSVYGGWAKWFRGNNINDIYSSYAVQLFDETHWESMKIVILVVDEKQKKISSSYGMKRSVENSKLLKKRVNDWLPEMLIQMEDAIENKDSQEFFKLTSLECENFHDVCMDTIPILKYRNETSLLICDVVNAYNEVKEDIVAGYTFDAGPNAIVFCEDENLKELCSVISHFFPGENVEKILGKNESISGELKELIDGIEKIVGKEIKKETLSNVYLTEIGSGPRVLSEE